MKRSRWTPGIVLISVAAVILLVVLTAPRSGQDGGTDHADPSGATSPADRPVSTDSSESDAGAEDARRYSLDQRIDLPELPQAPRVPVAPEPDPNAPDSAAEGKLL